jgi:GNAT superfamily N-acetyltransferase
MTMVDPDYQRKGFGRGITRAFNDLSDKANAAIYVRAMPAATAMLQKEGHHVLETREVDFKDYGGIGSLKFTGLKREPNPAIH